MADDDSSGRFGLDEPVFGFMGDGAAPPDANSDPSNPPADGASQPFYGSTSNWDFQVTAPFASFDVRSATSAPPAQAGAVTTSWPLTAFDQPSRPQGNVVSPSFDGFPPSNVDSTTSFGSNSGTPTQSGTPVVAVSQAAAGSVAAMSTEELRNIAMPPHLQYNSPRSASSPDSARGDAKTGTGSSPELSGPSAKKDNRKRKVTEELEEDDELDDEDKPVKKTAHNMIEKRYRTNINDKIAALRDSVPSLRIMSKSARGEDTTEDREELHGLTPAHKLNKATVLSKATEYIRHLEKRNGRLADENLAMKERIAAFEKLFMAGAMNGSISPMQHPPTPMNYPPENRQQYSNSPMPASQDGSGNTPGMINVPEDMKRIISAQMAAGQPYPVPQQPFRGGNPSVIRQQQIQQQQQMQQNGWINNASPYFGKLMVGSLAGLMILEASRESETSNEEPQGRGLFALPIQLLGRVSSALDLHVMGYHVHTSLKLLLLLGAVLWIFVPSLFARSGTKPKKQQATALRAAPSLASSIHVRRQAWLTAIQTVWVPRHNFFLEAAALVLKTMKLSLRNAIGVHGYQLLTGLTQEQETARVQAWSIALDSQLAGGDVDICKSRLVLTLLASGTLPDTPARLMLKALHIRVLFWDLSHSRWQLGLINAVAAKLARKYWNEARQLNRMLIMLRRGSSTEQENELPDHLATLVEQECDEALSPLLIQRAHNLAFNADTTYEVNEHIDGMDAVVDDLAVGSPMDAVAAWCSTESLHHVLTATLDEDAQEVAGKTQQIELAARLAPHGSAAQLRATLARAVFVDQSRTDNIEVAGRAMTADGIENTVGGAAFSISPCSHASNQDLELTLDCALAMEHLSKTTKLTGADMRRLRFVDAISKSESLSAMTLLSFTACMELMKQVLEHQRATGEFEPVLTKLSSNLRIWMGKPWADKCGVNAELRNKIVERCLAATKAVDGAERDTGYGSMSEAEEAS